MPEPAALPRAGLYATKDTPVPLAGVSIDAQISDLCARVVVAQRFVNREETPIEATYVFPLEEGAAVCGFEAVVDGTLVIGEVKSRDKAFEAYDDAMIRGDGAFLLDEERPDVFVASVGNLPPGREVLLKLTYVTELAVDDGSVRFVIPTTVSPRYAPGEDTVGIGRPDSETLNPPAWESVPYGLELAVHLAMSGAVTRLESPSHPVAIGLSGDRATVTLSQRDAALDRDFVLAIDSKALDRPQAWMERTDDGTVATALAFIPDLASAPTPTEVIFVVDRSGSMGGSSIAEVRNALQLCLRSMTSGCRFNIIGFGSRTIALFPQSREYDESALRTASAHVASLDADLGGTEILPALRSALESPRHGSLARQVVVFTDGEVTNTDAVLALAARHADQARIFTFGIGAGASHYLVKGLARVGRGSAEFIFPGERIEPKVVRQFGRLLSPALTNVRVHWDGLDVTQAPSEVPPVFAGGRLLVYGFLRGDATVATVRFTADAPSGPLALAVQVDPARAVPGMTVATLAARARVRELEESPGLTSARGSRQSGRKAEALVREIVDLGTRFGLVSRETSYVAIERRETPVIGDVRLRRVPIALTTGWGGMAPSAALSLPMGVFSGALRRKEPLRGGEGWDDHVAMARRIPRGESPTPPDSLRELTASLRAYRSPEVLGPMHALIDLQRADGSWDLTRELASAIGIDVAHLTAVISQVSGDRDEIRAAWATALALAWLARHAADAEDQWRLLARKAQAWLDGVSVAGPGGAPWRDAAESMVKTSSSKGG
jgi:hypothetical protein